MNAQTPTIPKQTVVVEAAAMIDPRYVYIRYQEFETLESDNTTIVTEAVAS